MVQGLMGNFNMIYKDICLQTKYHKGNQSEKKIQGINPEIRFLHKVQFILVKYGQPYQTKTGKNDNQNIDHAEGIRIELSVPLDKSKIDDHQQHA
jgi:hypothetical protein